MTSEELGFRLEWLSIPNLASQRLPFLLKAQPSPFLHALDCLIIVSLNRWNRLSPLLHYCDVKGTGFGWTYPTQFRLYICDWTEWSSQLWLSCFAECGFRQKYKRPWDSWNVTSLYVSQILLPTQMAQLKVAEQAVNLHRRWVEIWRESAVEIRCHYFTWHEIFSQCGASTRCTEDALTIVLWQCISVHLNWRAPTWELGKNAHLFNLQRGAPIFDSDHTCAGQNHTNSQLYCCSMSAACVKIPRWQPTLCSLVL